MSTTETANTSGIRLAFFDYLFGGRKGLLCIVSANRAKANLTQKFFEWPLQRTFITQYIDSLVESHHLWFNVSLLNKPERRKEACLSSTFVWADLDEVDPTTLEIKPTCSIESSPGRFQGYWRISGDPIPPDVAEDYSRRIAYSTGADKSGWDMVQLLRVPWTYNYKYDPPALVKMLTIENDTYDYSVFDELTTKLPGEPDLPDVPDLPSIPDLPTIDTVLYKYSSEGRLDEEWSYLYTHTPSGDDDWSRILWRFIHKSFDTGMSAEEVFTVAINAKCNKYARDNRPITYLWRDITKASAEHQQFNLLIPSDTDILTMPQLVDKDEVEPDTFIRDYISWALQATDAPEQYHELSCFITLSAIVSPGLFLRVEWGELVPNLWGLVLGESTLTRKTTAMRLAVDMLNDIDDELILASDGSAEGLLTGLSHRPKRVSIFWKDEVSGFFDSINRKDYLAGLPEVLTNLYDVPKVYSRLLRKETITINEPYFIFFGGGIRDKVYSLITEEYILSGFLPRFLVVSGENDLTRIRRTGPPTILSTERKDNIVRTLSDLRDRYCATVPITIAGQTTQIAARIEARLTETAWGTFGEIEDVLTRVGAESDLSMLALPTMSRMGFSILKMALLVAASRRLPGDNNILSVESSDVKQAAYYVEKWGHYSIDMMLNAGKSNAEKQINKAITLIKRREGITKAEFMQRLHLSARESKDLIDTMSQRGLIMVKPSGRGVRLHSV